MTACVGGVTFGLAQSPRRARSGAPYHGGFAMRSKNLERAGKANFQEESGFYFSGIWRIAFIPAPKAFEHQ